MPSVVFWSGQPGGTAWYRCLCPGRALERRGWTVDYYDETILVSADDGHVKGRPDYLVVCRIIGDRLVDTIRTAQSHGTTVIYDTDDWFRGLPDYNPASALPAEDIDTMHRAMEVADLVTCSTPELAEGYADLNRTVVLPNYLDPRVWRRDRFLRHPHDGIWIGWMGAFNWRAGDLDLFKPWVPRFLHEHPDVRFLALGCPELADYLGIDCLTISALPSQEHKKSPYLRPYQHLPDMIVNLDIGLVPLRFSRFNQAKSWCKGMEYNACGVPAVASPSREYRTFIRPGVNGLLVRHDDWARAVEKVMDDLPTYRRGAYDVAAGYYIDDHIQRWIDAYASARSETVSHLRGALADL